MPTSVTPKVRVVARRLLAHESASSKRKDSDASVPFLVCEKLRAPLAKLMGVAGFHSLLARALTLATVEVPALRALRIAPDGSIASTPTSEPAHDPRTRAAGEIALTAQLLGLLITFIGPALTQRLLLDVWPEIDDLEF